MSAVLTIGTEVTSISHQHEGEVGTISQLSRGPGGPAYLVQFPTGEQFMFPEEPA